jgi:hypothetical protein
LDRTSEGEEMSIIEKILKIRRVMIIIAQLTLVHFIRGLGFYGLVNQYFGGA